MLTDSLNHFKLMFTNVHDEEEKTEENLEEKTVTDNRWMIEIQKYRNTEIQKYRNTKIQKYKNTKNTKIQKYKYTKKLKYKNTKMLMYRNSEI